MRSLHNDAIFNSKQFLSIKHYATIIKIIIILTNFYIFI